MAASSPVTRHSSSLTLWPGATDARYHEYRHEYDRRFSSRPAASSRLMLPTESARLLHSHTQTDTAPVRPGSQEAWSALHLWLADLVEMTS